MPLTKNNRRGKKKSARKKVAETIIEFAESTTIHGLAYMVDRKHSPWRPAWVMVGVLALIFSTYSVFDLYMQWQNEPLITSLKTVAMPIEKIKFPAITICPQGSRQEILDSVLYRQFTQYISKNPGSNSKKLTLKEMTDQFKHFLNDTYPGAARSPTELTKLITSDDPEATLENDAVLGLEKKCDPSSNQEIVDALNKDLKNDTCPDGFEMLGGQYCVHTPGVAMSNDDAHEYCNGHVGAELLYLESYEEARALMSFIIAGIVSKYITCNLQIANYAIFYISFYNKEFTNYFRKNETNRSSYNENC